MALYDTPYVPGSVYAHARTLLERVASPRGGVHLDIGCGFGRIAEALRDELGVSYVGLDIDAEALASLRSRGFEAVAVDLRDVSATQLAFEKATANRRIASISILDTLEHLAEPGDVLQLLYGMARAAQCPLVASVPNVAHRDVGFKLSVGRWEYTRTGLLDRTHLRFFTEAGLRNFMQSVGFYEVAQLDIVNEKSDQSFPALHPVLSQSTALHSLLSGLRSSVDASASTIQFVRAYLPGHPADTKPQLETRVEEPGPFLSVVIRTQGRRLDTLREALLSLSAQTDQDFEVIVIGHRLDPERQLSVERILAETHDRMRSKTRFLRLDRGNRTAPLNEGFAAARGEYVAILDDDDFVFAHWIETFRGMRSRFPGRVLRACTVVQAFEPVAPYLGSPTMRAVSGFEHRYPREFDLLDHLVDNKTPCIALAFPRSAFADLHIHFDEDLTTAEDWDFLVRVAAVCDVASTPAITSVYRQVVRGQSSLATHSEAEWRNNRDQVWRKLDRMPIILPAGSAARIRLLVGQARGQGAQPAVALAAPRDVSAVRERARVILSSRSWRLAAPMRIPGALLGRTAPALRDIWSMTPEQVEQLAQMLERSWSWRLTGVIRAAKRILFS